MDSSQPNLYIPGFCRTHDDDEILYPCLYNPNDSLTFYPNHYPLLERAQVERALKDNDYTYKIDENDSISFCIPDGSWDEAEDVEIAVKVDYNGRLYYMLKDFCLLVEDVKK